MKALPLLGSLLLATLPAQAAPTHFGANHPFTLGDLPHGRFRTAMEALPAPARQRALSWLHSFNFPAADLDYLQVDPEGGILYVDPQPADEETAAATAPASLPAGITPETTFFLHSRPGAGKVIYLDFDGHTIADTAWNSYTANPLLIARPYSLDADDSSFSSSELVSIAAIWRRIAEDYAPFDVDVTTELPASFGASTGRILITRDTDANGNPMPAQGAGGVAYVGVFGSGSYGYYSPALVYFNRLGGGREDYVSEAASHEMGHNLSLSHDGSASSGYYGGHGSGETSWGPIMGTGYNRNVSQWSQGEYDGANNTEDDVQLITNRLGLRPDDHGNGFTNASPLASDGNGQVTASTPDQDPDNLSPGNKGIIGGRSDQDVFYFDTGSGPLSLTILPNRMPSNTRGGNLDVAARLYDDQGNLLALANPDVDTRASLALDVIPGRYYLAIDGVGDPVSPYSDYASLGQYFISGSLPLAVSDLTPPTPNPMQWDSQPVATGHSTVSMRAAQAVDDQGGSVQYYFACDASGAPCTASGWQDSQDFVATGLGAGSGYSFQVKARDAFGNETGWSDPALVTTPGNQAPVANDDTGTLDEDGSLTLAVLDNDSDPDGDPLTITGVGQAGQGSVSHDGSRITYQPNADFNGSDSVTYTIADGFGGSATASVSLTVNPVNDPPLAVDDSASVAVGATIDIPVLANDSDPDGDTLMLLDVGRSRKGTATLSGDMISYTAGSRTGSETLSYQVSDGHGGTASAQLNLTITASGGGGGSKCNPKRGC